MAHARGIGAAARVLAAAVLAVAMLTAVPGCAGGGDTETRSALLAHLEGKYGEEFVPVEYTANRYASGKNSLLVSSAARPDVLFEVKEEPAGSGQYFDDYPFALWSDDLAAEMGAGLGDEIPDGTRYSVAVGAITDALPEMVGRPFSDYVGVGDDGYRCSVLMAVPVKGTPTAAEYGDLVNEALEFARGTGAVRYGVSVGFVRDPAAFSEYVASRGLYGPNWGDEQGDGLVGTIDVLVFPGEEAPADPWTLYRPAGSDL